MLNNKWYRLAYEFHLKYSPFPKSTDDWCNAAEEAGRICGTNDNDPLLMSLIMAVYDDFDREYKAARERGEISEEGI